MKKFYTTALFLAITSMNSWAMESSNKYGQGKKQSIHNNNRALDNSSESDDEIGQMARKMSKFSLSSKSNEIKKTRIEKVDKKCMQETGGLLKDLLENGEERMQKLINKSDPQTAENIKQNSAMFKQFAKPMKLLKSLLPDMGKLNK